MENSPLVHQYLKGLQEHLSEDDKLSLSYATGATAAQLSKVKDQFPQCPNSLLQLLSQINGTYWQQYGDHEITVLILGSDVYEYPYYLKSAEQILEDNHYNNSIREIYREYMDSMPELVGPGIDPDINISRWLCFSDCMNNGGTSSLFLDFNPLPEGRPGQVVRFLHDPDSFLVITADFDEYLQMLIDADYDFIRSEEE